jgi:hypothetical protein
MDRVGSGSMASATPKKAEGSDKVSDGQDLRNPALLAEPFIQEGVKERKTNDSGQKAEFVNPVVLEENEKPNLILNENLLMKKGRKKRKRKIKGR